MESRSLTLEELRKEILRRIGKVNPFERVAREDVEEVVGRLHSLDPDHWGFDPPAQRIEIPIEGKKVTGYLQIPRGAARPPVVMHCGGVDGWKEDSSGQSKSLHQPGLATFVIDMPGAGENPLLGQEPRAERTFSTAIDYLEKKGDVDGKRIAVMGRSFGGYWAAKLAYAEGGALPYLV